MGFGVFGLFNWSWRAMTECQFIGSPLSSRSTLVLLFILARLGVGILNFGLDIHSYTYWVHLERVWSF